MSFAASSPERERTSNGRARLPLGSVCLERIQLGEAWAQAASEYVNEAHLFAMSLRVLDKRAFARTLENVRAARARTERAKQELADHIERHGC